LPIWNQLVRLLGPVAKCSCMAGSAATTSSPYFHYLSPGEYTLVVEDEWNQTICAPFQVSATSKNHIGAVSVTILGNSPEGGKVNMSLKNIGQAPIASLSASLTGFPAASVVVYSFVFNASSSNPLLAGQSAQSPSTLVGYGLSPTKQYPLTVTRHPPERDELLVRAAGLSRNLGSELAESGRGDVRRVQGS
jgi:hypothetical protein